MTPAGGRACVLHLLAPTTRNRRPAAGRKSWRHHVQSFQSRGPGGGRRPSRALRGALARQARRQGRDHRRGVAQHHAQLRAGAAPAIAGAARRDRARVARARTRAARPHRRSVRRPRAARRARPVGAGYEVSVPRDPLPSGSREPARRRAEAGARPGRLEHAAGGGFLAQGVGDDHHPQAGQGARGLRGRPHGNRNREVARHGGRVRARRRRSRFAGAQAARHWLREHAERAALRRLRVRGERSAARRGVHRARRTDVERALADAG